jgi:hypothetical protein
MAFHTGSVTDAFLDPAVDPDDTQGERIEADDIENEKPEEPTGIAILDDMRAFQPVMPALDIDNTAASEIWQPRPDESSYFYGLFRVYCGLGITRNLAKLAKKTRLQHSYVRIHSAKFEWTARVKAYDLFWFRRQDECRRREQDAQAARWARRREEQKEYEWTISVRLREQIEQMINWPLIRETLERDVQELSADGITVKQFITQEPADWSLADMTRFLLVQSKFARLAAGMNSGVEARRIRTDADLQNMTDMELERLANQ